MKHKQLIIPIFVPHSGCPHKCVFCNQEKVSGKSIQPSSQDIEETIVKHLNTWKGVGRKEAAFYGGTFTAISFGLQEKLLSTAYRFVQKGEIDGIRVSTRPDATDDERLALLKRYKVDTVELGVQSMDDAVLDASGREHTSEDTRNAVMLLKKNGFKVGIQIMPGLPADTNETILYTAKEVCSLLPDFVRIYPTLVIRGTALERLYLKGLYKPWHLQDMVNVCSQMMRMFAGCGIPVVRVGLHCADDLKNDILAGPIHPSFRQLVDRRLDC